MPINIHEGNFVAFRNTKLKDTHPDYKGEILPDRVTCPHCNTEIEPQRKEIVIWVKTDKNQDQFLSGSINEKKTETLQTGKRELL